MLSREGRPAFEIKKQDSTGLPLALARQPPDKGKSPPEKPTVIDRASLKKLHSDGNANIDFGVKLRLSDWV